MINLRTDATRLFDWGVKLALFAAVFFTAILVNTGCATAPKPSRHVTVRQQGATTIEGPCTVSTPRPNEIVVDCP